MKTKCICLLYAALLSGLFFSCLFSNSALAQITANINTNNPNFPFPQFKDYTGGTSLASKNPQGVPHAEMEQRIRDGYQILCNNMTYNINKGGVYAPVTVAGVKYISPTTTAAGADISHCTCVEGDGYYLLAAAYMADKPTFDGYYMWMHDRQFQKTKRYIDGVTNSPGYAYSPGISGAGSAGTSTDVLGGGLGGNSATDGDVDVAMALLVAWKQWGDLAFITNDPNTGTPIYYKTEAIKYIKTLVDTLVYAPALPVRNYLSGDIGLDGYLKGGDSWNETSNWASGGTYMGLKPQTGGPQMNYVDYYAPAYFRSFGDMLTAEAQSPWCIKQYRRGEASGDWVMGQAYTQGFTYYAGQYNVAGSAVSFSKFNSSEDFRFGWRTILNYVWNGAPNRTWDPVNHQDIAGSNSSEYDMAMRMATFLKNPEAAPYNNGCYTGNTLTYGGPANLRWDYALNGTGGGAFPLNWAHGSGAPSAVVSGDADLMARMFRHCVIEWDQYNDNTQRYLTSKPRYFHEWFRLLGMLVLSGNLHDPMDFAANGSNMKVYKAVDKTFAYSGDTITYTISYRNYSKTSAAAVVITDNLPAGLSFISATGGGTAAGSTVTWNLGTVPGFVTGGLAATMGSVTVKAKVTAAATGRLCNVATISTSNGTGWTSNEYPNNITDVMERNCVDILPTRPLTITKVASKTLANPGDVVTYTITVKNNSVPFLNGGRPGVRVAFANGGISASANSLTLKHRIYHGAHEAYINYANYRTSYFLNKPGPPAWILTNTINEGVATVPTFSQQTLIPGPTWNHRFILQFPSQIATITQFLYFYSGQGRYIHEGALMPQRMVSFINSAGNPNYDWTTDWSAEPGASAADGHPYWPVANDWTDPLLPNQPVLKYSPDNCSNNVTTTVNKLLVEEYDGYTWRRIYGNGPVSGRELNNVVVTDALPSNVTFAGFVAGHPAGTVSGGSITWPTVPILKINDSLVYQFNVTVNGTCPTADFAVSNTATAKATNESPVASTATLTGTCSVIPTPPPVTASMAKLANAASYSVGNTITYTLKYKNKDGAVVSGATLGADWNDMIGNGKMTVTAGTIDLNTGWTNKGMVYKYSHGKDGYIRGTLTLSQFQPYSIIMRYNGTTWTEARFNIQAATVQVSFFNMPANTQIGVTQTISYGALPGAFDFQIQLSGANVNVWLVNSGAAIGGPAPITQAGITVQAGYAGVKSAIGNPASLSNWYTGLDSGFNLQMTDAIPTGITYTSASNATLGNCPSCGAGPYTGSNVGGVVTWQTIAGPILANDSITYVWNGTVSSCTSGSITNIAYIKMQGITPNPGAQVIVNSVATTPVTWVDLKANMTDGQAMVTWSTASETNNDHFVVQKSSDGIDFYTIGSVKGNGNTNAVSQYSFADKNPASVNYYRLVQVDVDGSAHTSKVVYLAAEEEGIYLFPNPYQNNTSLTVKSASNHPIGIRVTAATGNVVYSAEGT
ncbi:MAG: glycosyl hydrolase family 8, partial [Cytophagaceae bacterium]